MSSSAPLAERRGLQGEGELPGHGRAAQLGARVAAERGMNDRPVRQPLVGAGTVVIGDHDVDARRAGRRHLLDRRDPAIHGDDQRRAGSRQPLHRGEGQSVAVLEPAGDEPPWLGPEAAQAAHEDRSRGHAVDVVVAVDDYPPARARVAQDRLDGALDPVDRPGRMRLFGGQERLRGRRVGEPAAHQHLGQHVAAPQLGAQPGRLADSAGSDLEAGVGAGGDTRSR